MSSTYSRSATSTYTEARAQYVLEKVYVDLVGLVSRGVINKDRAKKWFDNLKHLMGLHSLAMFEIQATATNYSKSWRYDLVDDGTIYDDADSGGIDLGDLPTGTSLSIVVDLKGADATQQQALAYLATQGWGNNGKFSEGTPTVDRSFSKDGYGLKRTIYGAN